MSKVSRTKRAGLDWLVLSLFFALALIGWLMLFSYSYSDGPENLVSFSSVVGRHTVWLAVSVIAFLVCISIDWRVWMTFSYPIYAITTLALIAVLLFGKVVKGASSWFEIFGLTIQPSEIAKFGTSLAVASFLSQVNLNLNNVVKALSAAAIFLTPALLIFIQPDAGTAIIFLSFLIPLYRAGLHPMIYVLAFSVAFIFLGSLIWSPPLIILVILLGAYFMMLQNIKDNSRALSILLLLTLFTIASYPFMDYRYILLLLLAVALYFSFLLFREAKYKTIGIIVTMAVMSMALAIGTQWAFDNILKKHQQARINTWLKPSESDRQGSLYNLIQSKTAIGSGGFSGKGYMEGSMTKLDYVPEQATDFVFTILGEEQGFIGGFSVIFLMTFLIIRLTIIAEKATLPFVRYYSYCLAGIFFFHFFINIGMTLGIVPVIGIPLPLLSKGGSSLVTFFIMMAILVKMDSASRRI